MHNCEIDFPSENIAYAVRLKDTAISSLLNTSHSLQLKEWFKEMREISL